MQVLTADLVVQIVNDDTSNDRLIHYLLHGWRNTKGLRFHIFGKD